MKKVVIIIISALTALIIWRLLSSSEPQQQPVVATEKETPQIIEQKDAEVASEPQSKPAPRAVDMSPFQLTSTQKAAKVIANNYRETLRYAPYSQPLTRNDTDRLEPNRFVPVTVPTSDMSGTISLALNKYRFIHPDPIQLTLSSEQISRAKVVISLVDDSKVILEKSLRVADSSAYIEVSGREEFYGDLQLKVEADVAGDPITIVAQAKYEQPSAKLIGLKRAEVNGSDLQITLALDVEEAGIYRVRANLYDGAQPLAHLVAKAKLSFGQQEITLKAHQTVLPTSSSDLRLMTFIVERMSSIPGERTRFGESAFSELPLVDIDLSELSRDPYSPNAKERASLEFLQGMAEQQSAR